jgi:hypothetical protein
MADVHVALDTVHITAAASSHCPSLLINLQRRSICELQDFITTNKKDYIASGRFPRPPSPPKMVAIIARQGCTPALGSTQQGDNRMSHPRMSLMVSTHQWGHSGHWHDGVQFASHTGLKKNEKMVLQPSRSSHPAVLID